MITYRTIAEKLGLSPSTVANILNGTPNYKKETVERALNAVEELGYQPNRASRAIRRRRSNLIGIIHVGLPYEIGNRIVRSVIREVSAAGYDYLVGDALWNIENPTQLLKEMVQSRVEGVILCGNSSLLYDGNRIDIFRRAGIPMVSLFGDSRWDVPIVREDIASGIFALCQHLQGLGHRKILMMVARRLGEGVSLGTDGRSRGFREAVKPWGTLLELDEDEFLRTWPRVYHKYDGKNIGVILRFAWDNQGHDIVRSAYQLSRRLLSCDGAIPDAIMATNDRAAYGVFNAAQELKLRVPDDLAITGVDDDEFSSFPMFRLTTLRINVEGPCRAAVSMLLSRLRSAAPRKKLKVTEQFFPTQMVLRRSCGRLVKFGDPEEIVLPVEPRF